MEHLSFGSGVGGKVRDKFLYIQAGFELLTVSEDDLGLLALQLPLSSPGIAHSAFTWAFPKSLPLTLGKTQPGL